MTETATQDNEDFNEDAWRIYEPRTRRLQILIGNEDWRGEDPRLSLYENSDPGEALTDALSVHVPAHLFWGRGWTREPDVPWGRFGTWQRYLRNVAWLKAQIRELDWTLTHEEQALVDALEAYAAQRPARTGGIDAQQSR